MSELTVFLEARLAEDETVARAHEGDPHWRARRQKPIIGPSTTHRWQVVSVSEDWENPGFPHERIAELMIGGGREEERPTAEFIARHDPARVLVEVEAKRAIVALHQPLPWEGAYCSTCDEKDAYPCRTLRLLASVYRDHPGYQEGWAL